MKKFIAYEKAVLFYYSADKIKLPHYLKDQILRASSSVALNLSEGNAKYSLKEKNRFYSIAYASLKECKTALELENQENSALYDRADFLGAIIYRLIKSRGGEKC